VINQNEIVARLRELRRRKPFVPFVITTADGKRHEVTEPLSFGFGTDANEGVAVMHPTEGIDLFRRREIVSIDLLEPAR